MIIISLERRESRIRIQIRDTAKVKPAAEIHLVEARLFADFIAEWKSLYQRSEALMQHAPPGALREIEDKVRRKGKTLAALIFAHGLPRIGEGPLLFSFDSSLSEIPYEILHLEEGFICERVAVLREVLTSTRRTGKSRAPESANRAVLYFDDSFSAAISESVNREKAELLRLFKAESDVTTKLVTSRPSAAALLEDLVESRYIHFSGHHETGGTHIPFLTPDLLQGADLHAVEAAFINACDSAETSDTTLTLAEAMIQGGVKNFVGFGLPVETSRAERIASSFWRQLLSGAQVTQVVVNLRKEVRERYGTGCLEWVSLQHFGTFQEKTPASRRGRIWAIAAGILFTPLLALGVTRFTQSDEPAAVVIPQAVVREIRMEQQRQIQKPHAGHQAAPEKSGDEIPESLRALVDAYPELGVDSGLRDQVFSFYNQPHPVYSELRKIEIIKETLNLDTTGPMKKVKLRSEMAKQ